MLNKKKKNTAVERTNKLKYVAKGLKGIKAISNALGTKPTDTPDVDTKITREFKGDESDRDNSSDRSYQLDGEGRGYFLDEKSRPTKRQRKLGEAY